MTIQSLPHRVTFDELGGSLEETNPQTLDPNTDRSADQGNAAFATIAGAAAVCPQLVVAVNVSGTTATITGVLCGFAGCSTSVSRTSTGVYVVSFAANVTDLQGVSQALSPVAVVASSNSATQNINAHASAPSLIGSTWQVTVRSFSSSSDDYADGSFALLVF